MAFTELVRGTWGIRKQPDNILRVSKSNLSLSENISETLQSNRRLTSTGLESVGLGIAYDLEAKQIKLIPGAINGFQFNCRGNSKVLRWTINRSFKDLGIGNKDFVLTDKENMVFTEA
jgi:hypothetical protein